LKRIVTLALLLCSTALSAETNSPNILESSQKAKNVVQRSIAAMGGATALAAKKSVLLRYSGTDFKVGQSMQPGAAYSPLPTEGWVFVDGDKRAVSETTVRYLGDYTFRFRNVVDGEKGLALNLGWKTSNDLPGAATYYRALLRSRPHLLVQSALTRANTLRHLGSTVDGKETLDIVTFADSDGTQNTLYFDQATGLLRKSESMYDDPIRGDVVAETIYPEYSSVDGIAMPQRMQRRENGEIVRDVHFDEIRFDVPFDPAWMTAPADFKKVAADDSGMTINEIGHSIYTLTFPDPTAMVIDLGKELVVIDGAPSDSATSAAALQKLKERFPGKAVSALALTHYHHDHTGGIRSYIAQSIPLLTTASNVDWIEAAAKAPHRISPDALSTSPVAPIVKTFEGKKVFGGGKHRVELYELTPTPHAKEMVIAYFPEEKLLFQSDLLIIPRENDIVMSRTMNRFLLEQIKRLKLDVETIIGFHGRPSTIEELRKLAA
jgi:glyoxylase-like metal-dependent hydrolase (beta-lactamase superfamily II)